MGGRRPFGWKADKRTLEPAEAEEIKRAAKRITAGTPVSTIVLDGNERGVRTSVGGTWVIGTVKHALRNPRICGDRSRTVSDFDPATGQTRKYTEVVLSADGTPVRGQWEPVLTVEEWQTLVAVMGERPRRAGQRMARKYLLTGLARCGKCGRPLRGASQESRPHSKAAFIYACHARSLGGCGGVGRHGPLTDQYITEAVLSKIDLELADAIPAETEWTGAAEMEAIAGQIAELTDGWKAKQISSARYFAILPELEQRERELSSERGRPVVDAAASNSHPRRRQLRTDHMHPERSTGIRCNEHHHSHTGPARLTGQPGRQYTPPVDRSTGLGCGGYCLSRRLIHRPCRLARRLAALALISDGVSLCSCSCSCFCDR